MLQGVTNFSTLKNLRRHHGLTLHTVVIILFTIKRLSFHIKHNPVQVLTDKPAMIRWEHLLTVAFYTWKATHLQS